MYSNLENLETYKKVYTQKLSLKSNHFYDKIPSETKKVLSKFTYTNRLVYDISLIKLFEFYHSNLLIGLDKLYPDIESFIKVKSAMVTPNIYNQFNQLQYEIQYDEKNNRFWITPMLSLSEELQKQIDDKRREELEDL